MVHDNETGDRYVPPEPPPIRLPADPYKALALIGLIAAPLVFVLLGILIGFEPPLIGTVCVIVFVASFITLFVRAKDRPRQDDGWDDGAVV